MIEQLRFSRQPTIQTKNWATLFSVLALLICGNALADDTPRHYRISAQPLEDALMQFATDTNLRLLFTADKVRGMNANGLDGSMTHAQALSRLLQGSGMTFRFVDAATVTIEPSSNFRKTATTPENPEPQSSNGEGQIMPKVTVEADSAYDPEYYADPYNQDYVIPNATAGTKTDTPIMETPLNVQVISKQVLKDQQVIRLDQALKNVSGVTVNTQGGNGGFTFTGGGSNQPITLRGFASQTFFRNGFRLQQGSASREMVNVESVEVLKGAAAILYGLVEPGGMVNVVTKQPLATPYYGFNQQFGSYDLYRTTFDATGPLTKNKDLLYRMNMSYENSGSFREFVGKEDVFLAPVLKWNISPQTQATFEMEYNHQHSGLDGPFIPAINGKLTNGKSLMDFPFSRNYGEYAPATTETIFGGFNWSHQFNDDWSIKHRFSVNQTNLNFNKFVLPSLVVTDGMLPGVPGNTFVARQIFGNNSQNDTYSTNLDLVGHFDTAGLKHTLLIGGDYYRLNTDQSAFFSNDFPLINILNPIHSGTPFPTPNIFGFRSIIQTDQFGLYAQDQIKLPYNVHLTGGLRYQYIHQNDQTILGAIYGGGGTSAVQTADAVTPRVGILWQPQNWISLYANYTESFGANTGLTWPKLQVVAPTSASQYEGGIKTQFFDGRLRATLAYYDLTKTNVAASDPNPNHNCGGGLGSCVLAIGAIRSRGPELDIQGEILPGWNAIATWSNTDIIITESNSNNDPLTVGGGDLALAVGSRMYNVPRNAGSFWTTYEVQDGEMKGIKFGGGVTLRDGQTACCDTPQFKVPGYATVGLMAAYSRDIGKAKVTAQLNIDNLLDKRYFSSLSTFDVKSGIPGAFADFGQPRTFMGSINIQY